MNLYYVVYFEGNSMNALFDFVTQQNTINKMGPYGSKAEAVNIIANRNSNRAAIVYHAEKQVCLHHKGGFLDKARQDLFDWAKNNILVIKNETDNDFLIEEKNEPEHWGMSKVKNINHNTVSTEINICLKNLSSMVSATIQGVAGNVPGLLKAVSDITIDICTGNSKTHEGEMSVKEFKDDNGRNGIIVFKGVTHTSEKKKMFKKKHTVSINGVIFVLVPISESARGKCNDIKNKQGNNIIKQIMNEFKL